MEKAYKIVYEGGSGEIVEKKSRFIADICPVNTEEEALEMIARIRKEYWDARHHCFAYRIGNGQVLERCSDDGEPAQTAGRPMLDVIAGEGLHNVCAVVTRYFGGTLLGTGGLVRAYSQATKEGLANCTIVTKLPGVKLSVHTDYNGLGKIQYLAGKEGLSLLDSIYTEEVELIYLIPLEKVGKIQADFTEATAGKARMETSDPLYYGQANGELIIF